METPRWLIVLPCLAVASATAPAAELARVDRAVKKEPAYQSRAPRYCLLVFGPQAKTRVWLVLDGDTLYIDRDGNGDLTDDGERVEKRKGKLTQFAAGDVLDADGKTKHTNVMVMQQEEEGHRLTFVTATVSGKRALMAGVDSRGILQFADKPHDAPIIHFGGDLCMGLNAKFSESGREELVRGDGGEELYAWVGTPGLGEGTFAAVLHQAGDIPGDAHPLAQIEFPNKKADGPPIKANIILKERC
jgi:hypothetical protein